MEQYAVSHQMLERLTEQVVQELKRRMAQKEQVQAEKTNSEARGKKRLLLLGSLSQEAAQSLSSSFELVCQADGADWELLLITELSVCTMSEVAHGIPGHTESACILKGLLCGRPIFLLEQGLKYRAHRAQAAKPLYLLYQKQEDQLKKMGIRLLGHYMDLLDESDSLPVKAPKNSQALQAQDLNETPQRVLDLTSLSLLREADLIRARTNGYQVFRLKQKAKITPLASDYIKNHSLTILRQ